ncbi:MAG: hypothetical protein SVT52_03715 [Planctomycetota bacterium]|nr:hypothetical protein [Planctomycetota bacterium]
MSDKADKTFVGFGFGAIQSGLFLFEARTSGNFSRFVVAEVDRSLVQAIVANDGRCRVNVAGGDRVDRLELSGIEIYNPAVPADRQAIIEAIAASDEIATALPSVRFYDTGDDTSVAGIIAEGLSSRESPQPTVIYAAENHNRAAEILSDSVRQRMGQRRLSGVQTLNTVIGKMSGVIDEQDVIRKANLATITPEIPRAILVERFNRILISRINLAGYRRGIEVFIEKDDLLPFEEAKLYGHNAIHALIGYLADLAGYETVAEAGGDAEIMAAARSAFLDESGAALTRRHAKLGDRLFTPDGFGDYAEDLLERMVCPNLNDLVARVCRDHVRKLGYDDRLYGSMQLALGAGIQPTNLALGAAAAVISMIKRQHEIDAEIAHLPQSTEELTEMKLGKLLMGLWSENVDSDGERLIGLTWAALRKLQDRA